MIDSDTMAIIQHVLWRSTLHTFSGAAVYLGMFWLLWRLDVRNLLLGMRLTGWAGFIVPSVIASFLIFLREPWDAGHGPLWWKSYIDICTWLLGTGWGAYALYRLSPRAVELIAEIRRSRADKSRKKGES